MRINKLIMIFILFGITLIFLAEGADAEDPEYRDRDAYFNPCGIEWKSDGCKATDPDWKFGFDALTSDNPEIYLKNDFVVNGDDDNPITVGGCYDLPCGEYKICFDALTDNSYWNYFIETEHGVDLYDVPPYEVPSNTNAKTITIYHSQSSGYLELESDNIIGLNSDIKTNTIHLYIDETPSNVKVYYYRNEDHKNILAGTISTLGGIEDLNFARVAYGDTDGKNIEFDLTKAISNNDAMHLELDVIDDDADIEEGIDNLVITLGHSETEFESIGRTSGKVESSELMYGAHNDEKVDIELGHKDEDHRTRYGIIIKDPESNGPDDKVELQIPDDNVKAIVSLRDKNDQVLSDGEIVLGEPVSKYVDNVGIASTTSSEVININVGSEKPTIETSLTGADDDYETGVYMEVGRNSIEYSYNHNNKLTAGDTINFLGYDMTLTYIDNNGISVSGEHICKVSGCVRDNSYNKVGRHAFDRTSRRECNSQYSYTNREDKTQPQKCRWDRTKDADGNKYYNCWAYGSPIKCEDERLQNEDMCTTQIGCKWEGEEELTWPYGVTEFNCYDETATKVFLSNGDEYNHQGKIVTLKNVGSNDQIIVDVDGVQETISKGQTETVNGVKVTNIDAFYSDVYEERSALLGLDGNEQGCLLINMDDGEMNFVIVGEFSKDLPLGLHEGYTASIAVAKASDLPQEVDGDSIEEGYWVTIKLEEDSSTLDKWLTGKTVMGMSDSTFISAFLAIAVIAGGYWYYKKNPRKFKKLWRR